LHGLDTHTSNSKIKSKKEHKKHDLFPPKISEERYPLIPELVEYFIYRVSLKSLNHLFSRYVQNPWDHRRNITARLKLRF
jgi:hypothetical protein